MDFDNAVQRLAKDQKKIRGRKPLVVSEQAKRAADLQRRQRATMQAQRQRERKLEEYRKKYMTRCDRTLHIQSLRGGQAESADEAKRTSLLLRPTSIHGQGDKISLPPSVLQTLTEEMSNSSGNPWNFRIGILNPDYTFPASPLMQTLKPPTLEDDHMAVESDDDEENTDDYMMAYLDELSYKYIAYRHCAVIEFTQEEGSIGLPKSIATALLDPENRPAHFVSHTIPVTRTVDPSASSTTNDASAQEDIMDSDEMATPGHVAYNAFDIPDALLEISLVRLPKGKGCTLVPTEEAVKNGFYGLKDVKLVLEQSLLRTRSTLSQGDIVSTWHRGVQFDLKVTKVIPSTFNAISCFNTDIEVDIGEPASNPTVNDSPTQQEPSPSQGQTLGTGRILGSGFGSSTNNVVPSQPEIKSNQQPLPATELLPEPPMDQTANIVNVQIRHSGGNGKRRFDVSKATIKDLLDFAASTLSLSTEVSQFRLVTRFPRRVFDRSMSSTIMVDAGIRAGQELFLVEQI